MSLSLIVCTIGDRCLEIKNLLESIDTSNIPKIECLIIDQNDDFRIEAILKNFQNSLVISHYKCRPGLSASRNVGIQNSKNEILCFPDDDCWYLHNTLSNVSKFFSSNPNIDILCGRIVDQFGKPCIHENWPQVRRDLGLSDTLIFVASSAVFVRRSTLDKVGNFDVNMGVGSRFGSCEEIDLVRRIIRAGGRGVYDPMIVVGHPKVGMSNDPALIRRARKYGQGVGYLLAKESAGASQVFRWVMRPLLGSILSAVRGRAIESRMRFSLGRGRFEGWVEGRRYLREKREMAGPGNPV